MKLNSGIPLSSFLYELPTMMKAHLFTGANSLCVKCGLPPPQPQGCNYESADEQAAVKLADAETSKSKAALIQADAEAFKSKSGISILEFLVSPIVIFIFFVCFSYVFDSIGVPDDFRVPDHCMGRIRENVDNLQSDQRKI
jgi:hypothetical protein